MNMRGGGEENAEVAEGERQGTRRGKEWWGTESTGSVERQRHSARKGDATGGAGVLGGLYVGSVVCGVTGPGLPAWGSYGTAQPFRRTGRVVARGKGEVVRGELWEASVGGGKAKKQQGSKAARHIARKGDATRMARGWGWWRRGWGRPGGVRRTSWRASRFAVRKGL